MSEENIENIENKTILDKRIKINRYYYDKYHQDESHRLKKLEQQRKQKSDKYANDPEFREKIKQKSRERYVKKKDSNIP
jgi:hypothetical protein